MNLCEPVIDWQKISQQVQAGIGLVLLDFKCKMLLFSTYSYIKNVGVLQYLLSVMLNADTSSYIKTHICIARQI